MLVLIVGALRGRRAGLVLGLLMTLVPAGPLRAQAADSPFYARRQTFGIFAAYSNDSSPMLLGVAERRKLLDFGVVYDRQIRIGRVVDWQYSGELMPVALESDPLSRSVIVDTEPKAARYVYNTGAQISCAVTKGTFSYTMDGVTYAGYAYSYCHGRRWTPGTALSPVGFQWNFLPRRNLQPFVTGHGGYLYTTQPVPVAYAGSFNFTFDFGAGLELFQTAKRSLRLEYRYHHISNAETAQQNPGIDSGLFQLTYAVGR